MLYDHEDGHDLNLVITPRISSNSHILIRKQKPAENAGEG